MKALVGLLLLASLGSTGQVTKNEYRSVHSGDYRLHVRKVFGSVGTKMDAWTGTNNVRHQKRKYHTTVGTGTRVEVTYSYLHQRWVVQRKRFCISQDFNPTWDCYKGWGLPD